MPEMRRNPITKSWSIIATERAKRPEKPVLEKKLPEEEIEHDKTCFFCQGNEHTTPPEVYAIRKNSEANSPDWSLRVVPNKFAALNLEQEFQIKQENALKIKSFATGVAEVIIESPHHSKNLALLHRDQIADLLIAYRDRYLALSELKSVKYILMFKNNGVSAGASLSHSHSQIIATPIIPINVTEELIGSNDYYESTGRCVYCDIVKNELEDKTRLIYENDEFIAFAPYASRTPFETWIMPKFHCVKYETLTDTQLKKLSEVWKAVLYKIYVGLDNPPYNYFIHTAPTQKNVDKYYHWHMELIPKLTMAAGFELGTGMYININVPEDCADFLGEIDVKY